MKNQNDFQIFFFLESPMNLYRSVGHRVSMSAG